MNDMPPSLEEVFADALQIDVAQVTDELTYSSIPEWDSVAHMALIAAIEDRYSIMLDTNDIIDLSSVGKAKEILKKFEV